MNTRHKLVVVLLPLGLLAFAAFALFGTACELVVNANLPLPDGSVSDVLDCSICSDVSADAGTDAADGAIAPKE
jgi:hypothetical protein